MIRATINITIRALKYFCRPKRPCEEAGNADRMRTRKIGGRRAVVNYFCQAQLTDHKLAARRRRCEIFFPHTSTWADRKRFAFARNSAGNAALYSLTFPGIVWRIIILHVCATAHRWRSQICCFADTRYLPDGLSPARVKRCVFAATVSRSQSANELYSHWMTHRLLISR